MTRRSQLKAALAIAAGYALKASGQQSSSTPSADEQIVLINKMRSYAESYVAGLPNFICTQITTHYLSGKKHEKWRKGDTVIAQLSFSNGEERSVVQQINNRPAPPHVRPWRWALSTSGEFGAMLDRIFLPETQTKFEWKGWDTLDTTRLASFSFSVTKENSTLELSSFGVKEVVPYQGVLWADPDSGHVVQILEEAVDIPPELRMEQIKRWVRYGEIEINGSKYMLPVNATILDRTDQDLQKNVIEFERYRKFEAESTLSFGDAQ